ncbi:hypothetical protein SAMN04487983_102641 [Streptomyces sp. yr375]|uniref:hypothetical protein n=1 Tax=Streptomyces sp. yr375 TaxID=1761906 RepID=UPI0008C14D21|nr:hypothetical protein [Streptomyces sp. yr375]SER96495.1 hypothetical protein SAMN04487983_102641 [Streptomyces sp. yr375]
MGVLARLFRRSKVTEELATEETTAAVEASAGTPEDGTEAAQVDEADQAAEASQGATGAGDTALKETRTQPETETETRKATGSATESVVAADGVEIPRQQSAEEAADSGAGESART